jgi:hypothetical protein
MHQSVLVYRNFRYLKAALLLAVAAIAVYAWHDPLAGPNGGSWYGYTLGGLGAALIVWLGWLGIRKRRYGVGKLTVQEWLSAHVYLGLCLIVIATLHTGFQFGWNLHTLAYTLMLAVIVSGIFGIVMYVRLPQLRTDNMAGMTLDQIVSQIADLGGQCERATATLPDDIASALVDAQARVRIGGRARHILAGADKRCPVAAALRMVTDRAAQLTGTEAEAARRLVSLLARQSQLLDRARREIRLKALMDVWLFFHIPLTVALIVALAVHVFIVFVYW